MAKSHMSEKDKEKLLYWVLFIGGLIVFFYQLNNIITFITSAIIGVIGGAVTYFAGTKLFSKGQ